MRDKLGALIGSVDKTEEQLLSGMQGIFSAARASAVYGEPQQVGARGSQADSARDLRDQQRAHGRSFISGRAPRPAQGAATARSRGPARRRRSA